MSDEAQVSFDSAIHGDLVTVEAEYTHPGSDDQTTKQWTLEGRSPLQVKDVVVSEYVPYEATLWRVGLWYGRPEDRPDGGHQAGILQQEEGDTCTQNDQNHSFDEF